MELPKLPKNITTNYVVGAALSAVVSSGAVGLGGWLVALPVLKEQLSAVNDSVQRIEKELAGVKVEMRQSNAATVEEISRLRERAATTEAEIANLKRGH